MENTKTIKGRISHKHGTEADWYAAGTAANPFIPLPGELIIYDPDDIYDTRTKIGDGVTPVHLLPWATGCDETVGLSFEYLAGGEEHYICTGFDENFSTYFDPRGVTDLIVPKGFRGKSVTGIAESAFSGIDWIKTINLPVCSDWVTDYAFMGCSSLESVFIPAGSMIGYDPFQGVENTTFYCEDLSQPDDWYPDWVPSGCQVVWGFANDFIGVNEKFEDLQSLLGVVSTTLSVVNELQKSALGEDATLPTFE